MTHSASTCTFYIVTIGLRKSVQDLSSYIAISYSVSTIPNLKALLICLQNAVYSYVHDEICVKIVATYTLATCKSLVLMYSSFTSLATCVITKAGHYNYIVKV